MFTGIIEELGRITSIQKGVRSSKIWISGDKIFSDLKLGDSVAVNGVCLTATQIKSKTFEADVMSETLSRSSLGSLKVGSEVNLERAMAADGRFGGHIVSGHIDGIGTIFKMQRDDNAVWVGIKTDSKISKYIIEKGSIAIDGISLTVARESEGEFWVSVIPHTGKETTLLSKKPGDTVNLENDVIGKYIERFVNYRDKNEAKEKQNFKESTLTKEFLLKSGF